MTQQEEDFLRMEKCSSSQLPALPAYVFDFPGMLPADTRLLLDPVTHTAILLSVVGVESFPMFRSFPLTPSAEQVFLSLLQAYPRYCSHRSLFLALYPDTASNDEHAWVQEKDLAIPLIRRALKSLLPTLRACGLQAISLRGRGYMLAATTKPNTSAPEPEKKGHLHQQDFSP
jgi:hypothetical protein